MIVTNHFLYDHIYHLSSHVVILTKTNRTKRREAATESHFLLRCKEILSLFYRQFEGYGSKLFLMGTHGASLCGNESDNLLITVSLRIKKTKHFLKTNNISSCENLKTK